MTDRILDKYTGKRIDEILQKDEPIEGSPSDPFGWLRGIRDRAVMLECRKKDGNIVAFNYATLERAEFDPSEGITLTFAGKQIQIKGRNLNAEIRPSVKLYEGITRHRIAWLRETDEIESFGTDAKTTVIDSISW